MFLCCKKSGAAVLPDEPATEFNDEKSDRKHLQTPHAEMHGFLGDQSWEAPVLVTECNEDARPGYQTKKAHEYLDTPEVLSAKIKLLADLIRKSNHCVAYTGAGISTASGIGDYATKAGKKSVIAGLQKDIHPFEAEPTLAHRVLTSLHFAGHLKYWVQQNHDGLPQKAGFPQEFINEIHGAWFDPSNPVVPMSGKLRTDLFQALLDWEEKADLCLTLGTSLCGMNADRMAVTPGKKSLKKKAIGTVIVSIQSTQYDNLSCLRIFSRIDDVMDLLANELSLEVNFGDYVPNIPENNKLEDDIYLIPFDERGNPCEDTQILDLSKGAKVRVTGGPNVGCPGHVVGKTDKGHYLISVEKVVEMGADENGEMQFKTKRSTYCYGTWWIEAACKGVGVVPGGQTPIVAFSSVV
jgi:NAD-dependent SIR2 family protein deacetylase